MLSFSRKIILFIVIDRDEISPVLWASAQKMTKFHFLHGLLFTRLAIRATDTFLRVKEWGTFSAWRWVVDMKGWWNGSGWGGKRELSTGGWEKGRWRLRRESGKKNEGKGKRRTRGEQNGERKAKEKEGEKKRGQARRGTRQKKRRHLGLRQRGLATTKRATADVKSNY